MTPLTAALHTLLHAMRADSGLLEVRAPSRVGEQRLTAVRNLDAQGESQARRLFSSGIIADALRSGEVVRTAAALEDPRYAERRSVQEGAIRAVLCAPVGTPDPIGIVYLERDIPFDDSDETWIQGWSEGVAPLLHGLVTPTPRGADATARARAVLRADEIVGRSQALARTLDQVLLARLSRAPALITGPTGAGKTSIARVIHRSSSRASGPFSAVNAANLQGDLLAAELFGVAAGAATSVRARRGLLAEADGGTLFIDEIGLLPLDTQARLLTFLDDGSYRQVGRDRPLHADVRLIGATNEDLVAKVEAGRFRADLLYRLDVLAVRVSPLSERVEDIPLLADVLIERAAARDGLPPVALDSSAVAWLCAQPWPGNIRQLATELHRGLLRAHAGGDERVRVSHLSSDVPHESALDTLQTRTRAFQRGLIAEALAANDGNRTATAKTLGISRSRLYELLSDLNVS